MLAPRWSPVDGSTYWPATNTSWNVPLADSAGGVGFYRVVLASSPGPSRGTLVSNLLIKSFSSNDVAVVLKTLPVPGTEAAPVEAWRLVYTTLDAFGLATQASTLLVIPQSNPTNISLVCYQHGTSTLREDVPSRLNAEGNLGVVLGASGYLAVLPDDLGLGDSPGAQPYHHAKSEAIAVVDALRAARNFLDQRKIVWNRRLFLTGYSQGGHVALATQRELEQHYTNEFSVIASAPCAGAYDLSGTTFQDFISNRLPPNPYYFALFLNAYVEIYHLAPRLADLLQSPFDVRIPPLLDGTHSSDEINAAMPPHPVDALKPEVLAALKSDAHHPLRLALQENDLYAGWVPQAPTRFYHCAADQDVLVANSLVTVASFKAAGAPSVEYRDPFSFANHPLCALFALPEAKAWFDSLRP
jgi:hypothetical protein